MYTVQFLRNFYRYRADYFDPVNNVWNVTVFNHVSKVNTYGNADYRLGASDSVSTTCVLSYQEVTVSY